jgi:hypothetical protein
MSITIHALSCSQAFHHTSFLGPSHTLYSATDGMHRDDDPSTNWGARATSAVGSVAYATKQLSAAQADLYDKLWVKVASQGNNIVDLIKPRTAGGTALLTFFVAPTGVPGY